MRVRIIKHSTGTVERVDLSQLLPGLVFEVPISLGTFLISSGAAEEDVSPSVALAIPIDRQSRPKSPGSPSSRKVSLIWIGDRSDDGRFVLKTSDVVDSDSNRITLWELFEGDSTRGRFDTRWEAQEYAAHLARLRQSLS